MRLRSSSPERSSTRIYGITALARYLTRLVSVNGKCRDEMERTNILKSIYDFGNLEAIFREATLDSDANIPTRRHQRFLQGWFQTEESSDREAPRRTNTGRVVYHPIASSGTSDIFLYSTFPGLCERLINKRHFETITFHHCSSHRVDREKAGWSLAVQNNCSKLNIFSLQKCPLKRARTRNPAPYKKIVHEWQYPAISDIVENIRGWGIVSYFYL